LAIVTTEGERLTDALASGGDLASLVAALRERETRKAVLQAELSRLTTAAPALDATQTRTALRARLADWRGLLRRQVPQARQILKKLLDGPVVFAPVREGIREGWRFVGFGKLSALLQGTEFAKFVASPTGTGASACLDVDGFSDLKVA
jgi:hypothetical protein